jgi:NAD(P) transhydrogenase subunit beta
MHAIIPHFAIGATGLMTTFLVMSGLAMLIVLLAASLYVVTIKAEGRSLLISSGCTLIGFCLSKLWMVSLLSMLALYNGIGGGAASAIATVEMFDSKVGGITQLVTLIVALVGAASLSGSLIAWTKLNGLVQDPLLKRGRQAFPVIMVVVLAIGCCVALTVHRSANRPIVAPEIIYCLLGCAVLFGGLTTLPLRRTQMPAMLSLYNAFTGLAIGFEGFILRNQAMMIVGLMIGTARVLVTLLMWRVEDGVGVSGGGRSAIARP